MVLTDGLLFTNARCAEPEGSDRLLIREVIPSQFGPLPYGLSFGEETLYTLSKQPDGWRLFPLGKRHVF